MVRQSDQEGALLLSNVSRPGNRRIRAPNQRKTLGFAIPDEMFAGLVDKAANAVTAQNAEGVRYGT
jgi:hypothetical protein